MAEHKEQVAGQEAPNDMQDAISKLVGGSQSESTEEPTTEDTSKEEAPESSESAPEATETPQESETPAEDEKATRIAEIKAMEGNAEKTEEEIEAIYTTEKENAIIKAKMDEIKARPENDGKTDEELQKIFIAEAEGTEETPAEEKPAEAPEQTASKTLDEQVSEHTSGQFNTIQELVEAASKEAPAPELSERIQHLKNLEDQGVDISQIMRFQALGIDNLNPENSDDAKKLFRLWKQAEEPDISERELDYLFNKDYNLNEDDVEDENLLEVTKLRLLRDAKKFKSQLLEKQKGLELPPAPQSIGETDEQREERETKERILAEQFKQGVEDALKGYEGEDFQIDENEKFTFTVSDTAGLKETMLEPDKFLSRYIVDGKTDWNKFRSEMSTVLNREKMVRAAYIQGKQAGREEIFSNLSNVSGSRATTEPSATEIKSPAQQVAANPDYR